MQFSARAMRTAVATLLVVLAACNDSTDPGREPEVTNLTNDFQLQLTALDNESVIRQYTWANDGPLANVTQSPTGAGSGTGTLIIRNPAGAEVYRRSLTENGTFQSTAGTGGNWTVRIEVSGYSGTISFRAQRGG
jgi:hypothetical protein